TPTAPRPRSPSRTSRWATPTGSRGTPRARPRCSSADAGSGSPAGCAWTSSSSTWATCRSRPATRWSSSGRAPGVSRPPRTGRTPPTPSATRSSAGSGPASRASTWGPPVSEVGATERRTLTGLGIGLAAAGVAAVAGLAVDRLWRDRQHAVALGTDEDFTVEPTRTAVVVADDGVPLHVEVDEPAEVDPDRPTLVFCHGYTLDLRSWVYQRRAMREAGYRVVVWDQRGHGSSGVAESDTYHVDQLGRDLRR